MHATQLYSMTPNPWFLCHSLTLAPLTGLASGRQHSGPGQHLPLTFFSHINALFVYSCVTLNDDTDNNLGLMRWCSGEHIGRKI